MLNCSGSNLRDPGKLAAVPGQIVKSLANETRGTSLSTSFAGSISETQKRIISPSEIRGRDRDETVSVGLLTAVRATSAGTQGQFAAHLPGDNKELSASRRRAPLPNQLHSCSSIHDPDFFL